MKTLAQLNEEVWEEYEKTKKPVCQYLVRNGYCIVQCELDGAKPYKIYQRMVVFYNKTAVIPQTRTK